MLGRENHLPEPAKELLSLVSVLVVFGAAFGVGRFARFRLPSAAPARQRLLANAAVAAPLAWGLAIFLLLAYGLSQMGH